MTRRAFAALTRHFVKAILEPSLLSDLGVDFLRRTLFTMVAGLLTLGLFLPRVFYRKYVDLSALPTPDAYLRALPGDTLIMIAMPMFLIGLAAVIVSPMLFPDETDYRVLTPLPLTRAQLFAAKLAALAIVCSAGVVAVNAIASLAFPLFSSGRWARHGVAARILAHSTASMLASAWMVSAIMAVQGACLIAVPARWRHRVTMALQAGVFLGFLVSVPFLVRLTGRTVSAATAGTAPQIFLPPIWFLGLEQWLLDGSAASGYARAAAVSGLAWIATVIVVVAACVRLFRSAETLAGAGGSQRPPAWRRHVSQWLQRRAPMRGPKAAIAGFAVRGLMRSRLHQFIFLVVVGLGLAMLAGQLLAISEGRSILSTRPREAVNTAIAAPLLLILCATIGLRAVFLLPLDRGASWVFRLLDDPITRPQALDGVVFTLAAGAIAPALILGALLQPPLLGGGTIPCLALTIVAGLVLIELVAGSWRRAPYTCSYLPGKRHLSFTIAILFGAYAIFVAIGANLLRWSILHPSRLLFTGGLLLALFAALRRARLRHWGELPLEFEDEDPTATIVVSLGPASS